MGRKSVVVLGSSIDLTQVDEFLRALEKKGFHLESSIPEIATFVGSVDEEAIAALRETRGVESVEEEDTVQLPPPDSDEPQ